MELLSRHACASSSSQRAHSFSVHTIAKPTRSSHSLLPIWNPRHNRGMVPSPRSLLSESELREFQSLVSQHAGASLTTEQADALAQQLLRVLFVIRETAIQSS